MTRFMLILLFANLWLTGFNIFLNMKSNKLINKAKDILFLAYDWLEMLRNSSEVVQDDE